MENTNQENRLVGVEGQYLVSEDGLQAIIESDGCFKGMPKPKVKLVEDKKVFLNSIQEFLKESRKFYQGRLRYNLVTQEVELDGKALDADTIAREALDLLEAGWKVAENRVIAHMTRMALNNHYDPFLQYLESNPAAPLEPSVWNNLAEILLGTSGPSGVFNRALQAWLIAIVARSVEPGCKADHALILQGRQGARKSTFFQALMHDKKLFTDSVGCLSDKDNILKAHKVKIIEWAEIEKVVNKADSETVKAALTCTSDLIRKPYTRDVVDLPRRFVICGTANSDELIKDATGSRRFWIVPLPEDFTIDIDKVKAIRNNLWASGYQAFMANQPSYLTAEDEELLATVANDFRDKGVWHDEILDYTSGKDEIVINDMLSHLGLAIDKRHQIEASKTLKALGWTKRQNRKDGVKTIRWHRH